MGRPLFESLLSAPESQRLVFEDNQDCLEIMAVWWAIHGWVILNLGHSRTLLADILMLTVGSIVVANN